MAYTQLNLEQRYRIGFLLESKFKIIQIAADLGRSATTIRSEIKRGKSSSKQPYDATLAQQLAQSRKANNASKLDEHFVTYLQQKLNQDWSPDQIAGCFLLEFSDRHGMSRQSIYNWIARDKLAGGRWFKKLRHGKPYRKRHTKAGRNKIPNRIDITQRPVIVDERSRVGDWEIDLVVGAHHKGMLITANERLTGLSLQKWIPNKSAATVSAGIIQLLSPVMAFVHTITSDNGMEFARHELVGKALKADMYFARPYASWQRGSNEHTNGLIRQYFPKGSSFQSIQEAEVLHSMYQLNHRPRKRHGYKTPIELFTSLTKMKYGDVLGLKITH